MKLLKYILLIMAMAPGLVFAEQVYKMGVVPQYDSRRIGEIWSPIIKFIAERAGVKIKLVGAPGIPEFERQFSAGVFDIAYMNPYHLIVSNRSQGYVPLVRDVGRKLHGVIVVRKDSEIRTIEDLEGKVIAFPAPNAVGASLMPRAEFAKKYQINIRPKYVNSHDSVYLNVAIGQADAGGGVQKTLERQSDHIRQRLEVLYKTAQFSSHPVVVHPRVVPSVQAAIKEAFMELGSTEAGRVMLQRIPVNKIGPATLQDYSSLKDMGLEDFFVRQ